MEIQAHNKYQSRPPDGGWGYLVMAALALVGLEITFLSPDLNAGKNLDNLHWRGKIAVEIARLSSTYSGKTNAAEQSLIINAGIESDPMVIVDLRRNKASSTSRYEIYRNVTYIPMMSFGLIYGKFLADMGRETTGTALANAVFNATFNFTGFLANNLLQKCSYRFVAMLGACFFFAGHFSIIFANTLWHLILSYGFIQGIGMGLMEPALYTALNSYFDRKLNFMNSTAQALMIIVSILMPNIVKFLMDTYGFRGTVAILAALSLHTVLAGIVLRPVKWHLNRPKIPELSVVAEDRPIQIKPLLELINVDEEVREDLHCKLNADNHSRSCWERLIKFMDLDNFKDPIYMTISMGISLAFTADVAFYALIPLLLSNAGLDKSQTTLMMSVYFGSDLAGRILLSVVTIFFKVRNRYWVLGGSAMSALFRTVFLMDDNFWWKIVNLSILGFLRAFIQTPWPLVMADEYQDDFARAFSLHMVICGCVSLIVGLLQALVKSLSHSDVMVAHVLSLCYQLDYRIALDKKKAQKDAHLYKNSFS